MRLSAKESASSRIRAGRLEAGWRSLQPHVNARLIGRPQQAGLAVYARHVIALAHPDGGAPGRSRRLDNRSDDHGMYMHQNTLYKGVSPQQMLTWSSVYAIIFIETPFIMVFR